MTIHATIRALTVKQPWAAAIASGHKNVENRTWHTRYRGPLAIHAGKQSDRAALTVWDRAAHDLLWSAYHDAPLRAALPGHIVALAELSDCHPAHDCCQPWGERRPEAWHWVLTGIRTQDHPIPCLGRLGLWNPDPVTMTALAVQLPTPTPVSAKKEGGDFVHEVDADAPERPCPRTSAGFGLRTGRPVSARPTRRSPPGTCRSTTTWLSCSPTSAPTSTPPQRDHRTHLPAA